MGRDLLPCARPKVPLSNASRETVPGLATHVTHKTDSPEHLTSSALWRNSRGLQGRITGGSSTKS
jgi:hypothetical protein